MSWIVALVLSVTFLGGLDYARIKRVVHLTRATVSDEPVLDPASATGYAGGKRWLIVPEHHNPTYQWIQETQQMFARGEWRVRRIDYENAPQGREVHTASPYHWWIAGLAWGHHVLSGNPLGWCVEQSALWADPLLHLLLVLGIVPFAARFLGTIPAILAGLGLTTIYPFAASFLPGVLTDHNLAQGAALWSILLAIAGLRDEARAARWWCLSGIAGGWGLWINAALLLPVLGGIMLGGILMAISRALDRQNPRGPIPWRLWGLGAATVSLLGYLVEYYPNHMELRLEVNHPLCALACLGMAEVLAAGERWAERGKFPSSAADIAAVALGLIAAAALPFFMAWQHTFPPADLLARQLTNEPDAVVASNVVSWLARSDASKLMLASTLLPLLFLVPAAWLFVRHRKEAAAIPLAGLVLGLSCVILAPAFVQLRWWSLASGTLLILGVILSSAKSLRPLVFAPAGLALFSGALQLVRAYSLPGDAFTHHEAEQVYERRLAHWIADHAGPTGAVVLAPPFRTPAFNFYGGLRGLGTQNWENRDGLATALRIASTTESAKAQAILNQRGVTHIVLPSWDRDLSEVARLSLPDEKLSFVYRLEHWTVFDWLRPLPFRMSGIDGKAEPMVAVLEVGEDGNRPLALSRATEYFIEMDRIEVARLGLPALREFPSDPGVLIALAQLEKACGDEAAFRRTLDSLVAGLAARSPRALPWNRRVNLAVVLTLGGRNDLAQPQLARCWREMTPAGLRSLTTGELYRLLVLGRSHRLQFPDPDLQTLALGLLPAEMRPQFQSTPVVTGPATTR